MSVIIASAAVLILIALIAYTVHHDRTSIPHLRSFAPICPNCDNEIPATNYTEPGAKARLRDHLKECEQW